MSAAPIKIPGVCFEALIGIGGMSEVWRGYHGGLNKEIAIKVMTKTENMTGEDVRQFMLESRVMEKINHPGIVHSYEADCRDGRYYFVMDYVDGYTFGQILADKERISEADAFIVLDSVAEALDYAWREHHVIHCDIKPDNLMVGSDGLVKIMDMGLCHVMDRSGLSARMGATATQTLHRNDDSNDQKEYITGTPAYISPDQIYGDKDLDPGSDIYCMGATLYHLVTGRILFPLLSNDDTLKAHVEAKGVAPDPRAIVPDLSEGLARLLVKMCVKERTLRYHSWQEVLADSRIVQGGGVPERPTDGAVSSIAEDKVYGA